MNTTSLVFCTLILVLRAAAAASAEDPAHAGHEQHPPAQELTPQGHQGHEQAQAEANSEPTESENGHVAPDPPQHPMHEMSSERMIELMQMEDDAPFSLLLFDELEWHEKNNVDAVHWDAEGWYGTDYNKVWLRSEGNGIEREYQGLAELFWDRIVGRWWHAQAGVRHDFGVGPSRDWIGLGVQGLAPHWFEVEATLYFGEQSRTAARFSGEVELLITQRLILQPKIEFDLYGKDDPQNAIGSGLADSEIGLRLRYEIRRELAPYVGVVWTRSYGDTADFARAAGDDVDELRLVAGLRLWF
jgi:copper resistance protein B